MQGDGSATLIYLCQLMLDLMKEIDSIKDLDPRYKNLKSELDTEIRLLEEEGHDEPEQEPMSTTSRKSSKAKQRRSILDLSRSICVSPAPMASTEATSTGSDDPNKENRPISTPATTKFARVSVGSGFSSVRNTSNQADRTNATLNTEDSFVIKKP
jgi:hypothetical protein